MREPSLAGLENGRAGFGQSRVEHPPGTIEPPLPVILAHVLHADTRTRAGRMDEFAFTHIDAHVAEGPPHGVEKHQIARLEFLSFNDLRGGSLFARPAWKHLAKRLLIDRSNKAAAVKTTGFDAIAAKFVGNAEKTHGVDHEYGSAFADLVACALQLIAQSPDEPFLCQQALHVSSGRFGR